MRSWAGSTSFVASALFGGALLGWLCRAYPAFSTVSALTALALGFYWLFIDFRPMRVLNVMAFIVGAEVLWRMTGADVLWEFGKYGTIALAGGLILRIRPVRLSRSEVTFLLLLVPSALMVVGAGSSPTQLRQVLSFNLAGLVSLALSVAVFRHSRLSEDNLRSLLMWIVVPLCGVSAVAAFGTMAAVDPTFGRSSNYVTSGGFGPNQVSYTLSLGAVGAFLLVFLHSRMVPRIIFILLIVVFASQSALTFSRGGVFMALPAIAIGISYVFWGTRYRTRVVLVTLSLALLVQFVAIPWLAEFTGDAIGGRFEYAGSAGRAEIMAVDLELWRENPIMGVGVGEGVSERRARTGTAFNYRAHAEYTRLLAEHGAFGLAAVTLLFLFGLRGFRRNARHSGALGVAVALVLLVWSYLYLGITATRTVAPSFLIGLASAKLLPLPNRRFAREEYVAKKAAATGAMTGAPE